MFRSATLFALLVVFTSAVLGNAGPISRIAARNNTHEPILMPGALVDGVLCYSDSINSTWRELPPYMVGIDYVRMPDSEARNISFEMDVTLSRSAYLYVLVNDVTWGEGPIPWMVDGTFPYMFTDTGDNVTRFVSGAHQPRVNHSVFVAEVPTGTVTLLWNHDSTINAIYGVAAAIPEPSTSALLGMGAVGLAVGWWRRRRRGA